MALFGITRKRLEDDFNSLVGGIGGLFNNAANTVNRNVQQSIRTFNPPPRPTPAPRPTPPPAARPLPQINPIQTVSQVQNTFKPNVGLNIPTVNNNFTRPELLKALPTDPTQAINNIIKAAPSAVVVKQQPNAYESTQNALRETAQNMSDDMKDFYNNEILGAIGLSPEQIKSREQKEQQEKQKIDALSPENKEALRTRTNIITPAVSTALTINPFFKAAYDKANRSLPSVGENPVDGGFGTGLTKGAAEEAFGQTAIAGLGRDVIDFVTGLPGAANEINNIATLKPLADYLLEAAGQKDIVDRGNEARRQADANFDTAGTFLKNNIVPEPGKDNPIFKTPVDQYTPEMKNARLAGSTAKTAVEAAAIIGSGNVVTAAARTAVPVGLAKAPGIIGYGARTIVPLAIGEGVAAGGSRYLGGRTGNPILGSGQRESGTQAGNKAIKFGTGQALTTLATGGVPVVGNIPVVKNLPKRFFGGIVGALTSGLSDTDPVTGAAFGAIGLPNTKAPTFVDNLAEAKTASGVKKLLDDALPGLPSKVKNDLADNLAGTTNVAAIKRELQSTAQILDDEAAVVTKQVGKNVPVDLEKLPINLADTATRRNRIFNAMVDDTGILTPKINASDPTGKKGIEFYFGTNQVYNANPRANNYLRNNENFQGAVRGLDKQQAKRFSDYANAIRGLDDIADGKKASMSQDELQKIVNAGNGEIVDGVSFQTRFKNFNAYYRDLLEIQHDAGNIGDEAYNNFIKNGNYIRIQKVMDDLANSSARNTGSGGGISKFLKKSVGSTRENLNALDVAANSAQIAFKEEAVNKNKSLIIDSLKQLGEIKTIASASDKLTRKEMAQFLKETKLPPIKKVTEFIDKPVREGLERLAKNLGIISERTLSNRGNYVGRSFTGKKRIELKAGAPERTLIHEIGHQLDEQFGMQDVILGTKRNLSDATLVSQIKKAKAVEGATPQVGKTVADLGGDTVASLEKQRKLNLEIRKLAALRYEGQNATPSYVAYTRKSEEKIAVMFEAYLHNRARFKQVAPTVFSDFETFLKSNKETAEIPGIQNSLVIGKNVVASRVDDPQLLLLRQQAMQRILNARDLKSTNKNIITRNVNGIQEKYEVSKEVKEAVDKISPYQLGILEKVISIPNRYFRMTQTGLNPSFALVNYLRDQGGAAINTAYLKETQGPVKMGQALSQSFLDYFGQSKDPIYAKFKAVNGDITVYDTLRGGVQTKQLLREIRKPVTGRLTNVATSFPAAVRNTEDFISITEKATRYQQFRGIYNKILKDGGTEDDALMQASVAAWQNSVDFNRMGDWMRVLNLMIPYVNASVQGSRTLARSFKERPTGTAIKTAALGIPIAGVTAWNLSTPESKEAYENINEYEKENNLIIMLPNTNLKDTNDQNKYNVAFKIPLPFGYGSLMQPVRRGIEAYADVEDNQFNLRTVLSDILKSVSGPVDVIGQNDSAEIQAQDANSNNPINKLISNKNPILNRTTVGGLTPALIKPGFNLLGNQDIYTGAKIIPDFINNDKTVSGDPLAENQKVFERTSASARAIGDSTGISPIAVEKFLKDSSGSVGQYGVNAIDQLMVSLGLAPEEQVGGYSVFEDLTKRIGEASAKVNPNKTPGQIYYENLVEVTKGLNGNEQTAFDSINPRKKNTIGEEFDNGDAIYNIDKTIAAYNQFPAVYEAKKELNRRSVADGNPSNPIFDYPWEQVRLVLEKKALRPGQSDKQLDKLWDQEWYVDFKADEKLFFDTLRAKAQAEGRPWDPPDNPYPQTPPVLQGAMNQYNALPKGTGARSAWIRANGNTFEAMKAAWENIDQWQNKQRGKFGLAATEGKEGAASGYGTAAAQFGSGGGGGGGGGGAFRQPALKNYFIRPDTSLIARKANIKTLTPGKVVVKTSKA